MSDSNEFAKALSAALGRVYPNEFRSYQSLRKAILTANSGDEGAAPDRRKLARLIDGKDLLGINFTMRELGGLDRFLAQRGGLSALMSPQSLLHALAEKRRVKVLVGSRNVHGIDILSRWDVRAAFEILRGLDQVSHGVHIDIEDISFSANPDIGSLQSQKWYKELFDDDDGPSTVCVGSPRSCHASEFLLARMCGTEPFVPRDRVMGNLPVGFGWAANPDRPAPPSAFQLSPAELGNARVKMIIDKEPFEPKEDPGTNTAYSVIFAQRRPNKGVWIVCAGHSAPATYGAAAMLRALPVELTEQPQARPHFVGVGCVLKRGIEAGDKGFASSMEEDRLLLSSSFLSEMKTL
jgi:hypothetical protein